MHASRALLRGLRFPTARLAATTPRARVSCRLRRGNGRLHTPVQAVASDQQLSAASSASSAAPAAGALPVVYIRAPLKPGDVVDKPGSSVVIVGNVPPGCRVSAGGDVVVMGKLLGAAEAGVGGNKEAMVVAMGMAPTSLAINGTPSAAAPPSSGPLMASLAGSGVVFGPAYDGAAPGAEEAKGGGLAAAGGALVSLFAVALLLAPLVGLGSTVKELDETLFGSILDSLVYGFILLRGANLLSDGSELLLEILDPGVIGGVVLPLLGAMPDSLIILVSGLSGTREQAQEEVAVGIGTLAGSTILLLSLTWGVSTLLGRCDLDEQGNAINRKLTRGWDLDNTGVTTDENVPRGALIMMATVLLYGIIQIPAFFGDISDPGLALTGSVICLLSCVAYCTYSVLFPELQKRRIDNARKKRFRMYAVRAMARKSEPFGSLMDPAGAVNRKTVDKIFDSFDRDRSGSIDQGELQALLLGLELTALGDGANDETLAYWLKEFDTNADREINKEEFFVTLSKWIGEKAAEVRKLGSPAMGTRALAMELPEDDIAAIKAVGKAMGEEEGQEEMEDEVEESEGGPLSTKDIALQAAAKMFGGIALCAVFSDPLVESLSNFSHASGIAPFYVGFVLTPLASNASEVVSSLKFAAKKRQKNISLTFSQVYGAVTMNNTFVLGLFLLVMYLRKLDWVYSSEVTAIVGSTLLLGAVTSQQRTFKSWWALPAIAIYPASLLTVQFLDDYFGWQ